jgi:hypothetical protein
MLTFRRIAIDLCEECGNVFDSVGFNREFHSTEIRESELQYEKHHHPKINE